MTTTKTPKEILEMHFGSDFHEINQPCYLDHIIAAMEEYLDQELLLRQVQLSDRLNRLRDIKEKLSKSSKS